jgi:glycosyltransferase involved in cell wall biosynthesis
MNISYLHGICVKNDGLSNSIRDEVSWLSSSGSHVVRLYTYACDYHELPATRVSALSDVAFDDHFQNSDLVVFHFGIEYPLFNLLPIAPRKAKRLVVFHNVTPREVVAPETFETIDKSIAQMSNIMFSDCVACVSQTNLNVLRAAGITTPAVVLPVAVHGIGEAPSRKPSALDGVVRIAFVGRFVRSKGPTELLEALAGMLQRASQFRVRLDMVGNISFSDKTILGRVREMADSIIARFQKRVTIQIVGDASEEEKLGILRKADLFVLPTYHEGFCSTIPEALANGCRVITYDNSNTPAICGGLARLTKTGDRAALSKAIEDTITEMLSPSWHAYGPEGYDNYAQEAWEYAQQFSPEATKRRFLDFISDFTVRSVTG